MAFWAKGLNHEGTAQTPCQSLPDVDERVGYWIP